MRCLVSPRCCGGTLKYFNSENTFEFYEPVFEWLEEYVEQLEEGEEVKKAVEEAMTSIFKFTE